MFRIRKEDEIAKLMLMDNCYKCIYLNYYSGSPEMPVGWCKHKFRKPDKLLCDGYVEAVNIDYTHA